MEAMQFSCEFCAMMKIFAVANDFKFLFIAPMILALLCLINWMTSPGEWWVQWAALGLGIPWAICMIRVMRAAVIVGGLAALIAAWKRRT